MIWYWKAENTKMLENFIWKKSSTLQNFQRDLLAKTIEENDFIKNIALREQNKERKKFSVLNMLYLVHLTYGNAGLR